MEASDTHVPVTSRTLHAVHLLGVDPDEMLDRLQAASQRLAARGQQIADPNACMLTMARREAEKNGVKVDCVEDITSPNEWKRGAAFARALGAPMTPFKAPPPCWPDESQRKRIAAQLKDAGLNPAEIEQKWLDACRNRTTRADYPQFASVERMTARHPRVRARAVR